MALTTSSGSSRPTQWATLVFGTKNPDLAVPNLQFYDPDTKTNSYFIAEGNKRQNIDISGRLTSLKVIDVEGYNDRKNKTGEKNAKRMVAIIDDESDPHSMGLLVDLVSDTGVPNTNALSLFGALVKHFGTTYDMGDTEASSTEIPIQVGLYSAESKTKKGAFYPRAAVRLPASYEGTTPVFRGGNTIHADEMAPQAPAKMVDGEPLKDNNGIIIRDYKPVMAWLEAQFASLEAARAARSTEQEGAAGESTSEAGAADAPAVEEDAGVAVDAVLEGQTTATPRPRG